MDKTREEKLDEVRDELATKQALRPRVDPVSAKMWATIFTVLTIIFMIVLL